MPVCRIQDVDLYYETAGDGPPVLLLHGLGSSSRDWENQIPELARTHRVIACDMRGHGRSEKPPGPYSVRQFAADAVRLLETLDAAPAHVVGLSMGGMIAFQMAVDTPEAVRSLIIANSGPEMILRTFRQRLLIRSRFAVVRLFGMAALGRMIAKPVFPKPEQAALRQTFEDRLAENDPRAYLDSLRALIGWSVADRIGGIRCPVLVIGSDQDYTPVEWKREYTKRIPGARLAVLEDSRHIAPIDRKQEFNHLLTDFLESTTRISA
jgi:pimeloyl-ACP methyl ester carboxylesterase